MITSTWSRKNVEIVALPHEWDVFGNLNVDTEDKLVFQTDVQKLLSRPTKHVKIKNLLHEKNV